jgi:arabinofuranosyltransferase
MLFPTEMAGATIDAAVAVVLLFTIAVFVHHFLNLRFSYPFEDAAILMRYAQHIADGFGIVWNIGDQPVDGGTDFLAMMAMAGLIRLGLEAKNAAQFIGILAHLLTAAIVYLAVIRYGKMPRAAGMWCAGLFLVGPGLPLISAAFTTPLFVMLASLTWYLAIRIITLPEDGGAEVLFSLSGLATGLARPEGVLLAGFMLAGIVYAKGVRQCLRLMLVFTALFAVLGGTYFLWRWNYFCQPLPNPYYKKGGFALHLDSLVKSIVNVGLLCVAIIPAFILGFRKRTTRTLAIATAIPIGLFTVIWVLMSNEMNLMMRYQYPVFPVALMSWPLWVRGLGDDLHLAGFRLDRSGRWVARSLALFATAAAFALMFAVDLHGVSKFDARAWVETSSEKFAVGSALGKYDHRHVIATTEAGLLPLYSQWRSLDTWGLNDPWIAHHGGITEQYLNSWRPDVIAFHGSMLRSTWSWSQWQRMLSVLEGFVREKHYILAAAVGASPFDVMAYYVRPDIQDSASLVESIRAAVAPIPGRPLMDFSSPRGPVGPQ